MRVCVCEDSQCDACCRFVDEWVCDVCRCVIFFFLFIVSFSSCVIWQSFLQMKWFQMTITKCYDSFYDVSLTYLSLWSVFFIVQTGAFHRSLLFLSSFYSSYSLVFVVFMCMCLCAAICLKHIFQRIDIFACKNTLLDDRCLFYLKLSGCFFSVPSKSVFCHSHNHTVPHIHLDPNMYA